MGSADHGTWLGTMVFDGARFFDGVTPDLDLHCARLNSSCSAMGMSPPIAAGKIFEIAQDGIKKFDGKTALYIRPMAWSTQSGHVLIDTDPDSTAFALCIEEMAMPKPKGTKLTTTVFSRPTFAVAPVNAKAACLYPNNARMLAEAQQKGFDNVITCDANGNVAETASANIFMVKNGEYFTPAINGAFLNGITRQRVIKLLQDAGETLWEINLTLEDFNSADEIFYTSNYSKISPVVKFEEHEYPIGPKYQLARELYWQWAGA